MQHEAELAPYSLSVWVKSEFCDMIKDIVEVDVEKSESGSNCRITFKQEIGDVEIRIEAPNPKFVRTTSKHILDQLLLILETIQFTKEHGK